MSLRPFVALAITVCSVCGSVPNMNGNYALSPTPGGNSKPFPTNYSEYPGGNQYFEVYSPPITTLYSQVFWTVLPTVPLPKDIVDKFDGKAMAVMGFEMDQVRRTPTGDQSVPITAAYNHHFESVMLGKHSRLERVRGGGAGDGHQRVGESWTGWSYQDPTPDSSIPTSQAFGGGNGGEYRKSFHGYPPGYAQIIDSPTSFSITPMQIDTWNRDNVAGLTEGVFVPGPTPKASLAPTTGPDAIYSGLLECPCTTRITRDVQGTYAPLLDGHCPHRIANGKDCLVAAKALGFPSSTHFEYRNATDNTLPPGCLTQPGANGIVIVTFNSASSSVPCSLGQSAESEGSQKSLVSVHVRLQHKEDLVTITLGGPSDVWFGVGWNATAMADKPWTIIVNGTGDVSERHLGDHQAGELLTPSLTLVSHTVEKGIRTVVLTRPLSSTKYFTFDSKLDARLPFINALGSGPSFAYHKSKTISDVLVLPVDAPTCVCTDPSTAPFGQAKGTINYGKSSVPFRNLCRPEPRTDMLKQHNPACDLRTYVGGQTCCHHMWSLLDSDQPIPWANQSVTYHLKFRFWYQPYTSQRNIVRFTGDIAAPVEYDVPRCPKGTPTHRCVHEITGTWMIRDMIKPCSPREGSMCTGTTTGHSGVELIAAHFHCHAPTCLSFSLYNNDTGKLLCREIPLYGKSTRVMDEAGYIAIPPCLWGSPEQGLESPTLLSWDTKIRAVKTANSTYGHHGEMAHLQMYGVVV